MKYKVGDILVARPEMTDKVATNKRTVIITKSNDDYTYNIQSATTTDHINDVSERILDTYFAVSKSERLKRMIDEI